MKIRHIFVVAIFVILITNNCVTPPWFLFFSPPTPDVFFTKNESTIQIKERFDAFLPEYGLQPIAHHVSDSKAVKSHLLLNLDYNGKERMLIYFVTPTYYRSTQMVDLTRLSNTLQHDKGIYWIIIEDTMNCTKRVRSLLKRSGLLYAHLAIPSYRGKRKRLLGKGIMQRNLGLEVIESLKLEGIVYFGDDDNAYDLRIFSELRRTRHVAVFPVGLSGLGTYERCQVDSKTGHVTGFITKFSPERKFAIDMAGFAFHSSILREKKLRFPPKSAMGSLETEFLSLIASNVGMLEPLMDNCTKIYVWHVKTVISNEGCISLGNLDLLQDEMFHKLLPSV